MLMALDVPLPKQVFGHPWLNMKGSDDEAVKMSKSRGNVLYADELVEKYGVDAVRYFVLHETPFDNDGVVSEALITERVNYDLANTLGNLVNRTVAMVNKYFGGVLNRGQETGDRGQIDLPDTELIALCTSLPAKTAELMDELRVADTISEIFVLFKRSNKYIDETMPWSLAKDPAQKERLSAVLYNLCECIYTGACLLYPFMPETSEKILAQLSLDPLPLDALSTFGKIPDGTKVTGTPTILFARVE
jgi:methionyl-tRNA synthetase